MFITYDTLVETLTSMIQVSSSACLLERIRHFACQIYWQITYCCFQINKVTDFLLFFIFLDCLLVITYCTNNEMSILFCLLKLLRDKLCNEKCLTSTNKCFWKDQNDIINAVRRRSQLKNQPISHCKTIDHFFEKRSKRIIKNSVVNFEEKAIEIINN